LQRDLFKKKIGNKWKESIAGRNRAPFMKKFTSMYSIISGINKNNGSQEDDFSLALPSNRRLEMQTLSCALLVGL
jgi:hypothetical protein